MIFFAQIKKSDSTQRATEQKFHEYLQNLVDLVILAPDT